MEHPPTSLKELTSQAEAAVRKREWVKASEFASRLLNLPSQSNELQRIARIREFAGTCHFMSAFYSDTREHFEKKARIAETLYSEAALNYQDARLEPLQLRAKARELFASFWLSKDAKYRADVVEKCIAVGSDSARMLRELGNNEDLAEIRSDLLWYFAEGFFLSKDWNDITSYFQTALEVSKDAIEQFESQGIDERLLEALYHTIWLRAVQGQSALEPSKFEGMSKTTIELGTRLETVSRKIGSQYALSLAKEGLGDIAFNIRGDYDEALKLYQEAILPAKSRGDSLLIGRLFWLLAAASRWKSPLTDSSKARRELLDRATDYIGSAVKFLQVPYQSTLLAAVHATHSDILVKFAVSVETRNEEKKKQLGNAIEVATRGAAFESNTWSWQLCATGQVKAAYTLSLLETSHARKQELLESALPIAQQAVKVTDALFPHFWNRGYVRSYLAQVKGELAKLETDLNSRIRLLSQAASDMDECLSICRKWATVPGLMQRVGQYDEGFGDILFALYQLTLDQQSGKQAVRSYEEAHEYYTKSGTISSLGDLSWKMAKVHDRLGYFKEASSLFHKAATEYDSTKGILPGLAATFDELGTYMKAWEKIENARLHHAEEQCDRACESYLTAAELLHRTKNWNRLSMLLEARSKLEKGEAESREEKHRAAIESFKMAHDGFHHARVELEKVVGSVTDVSEKLEIEDWLKVLQQREPYTRGRIELEEARSLDTQGEKAASSKKYNSASVEFRNLSAQTTVPQDRAELETLARFCGSWAIMKEAESKSSPELFGSAADSFTKAKDGAATQTLRLLASGNASICRALASGTKFMESRNIQLYTEVKQHLEVAADQYTEAGFKKTGTWTRATQRLFDALMFLAEAEVERETRKKTELYHTAEKHLELAARLFGEAGFPTKKRETLERLERTREEGEVLRSSLTTLAEIPTVSATHLSSLRPIGVQPLGLERYDEARVVGEVRTTNKEPVVGSTFSIEADAANVGRTPATLIKLENIVPEGAEPIPGVSQPVLEGSSVDLNGRRLEYLKTHKVKLTIRANKRGAFELKPRIVYVDQIGTYRSTDLQPLFLIIREPGVSEATHAPPGIHIPVEFQFENQRSREVFQQLVKEFLEDHMSRRIVADKAGWRSMMDIVRELGIPRSALYAPGGRKGPVLVELERRGLVETRIFPGERGRGGDITKMRVAYENSVVKGIVEREVMQNP